MIHSNQLAAEAYVRGAMILNLASTRYGTEPFLGCFVTGTDSGAALRDGRLCRVQFHRGLESGRWHRRGGGSQDSTNSGPESVHHPFQVGPSSADRTIIRILDT